MSQRTPSKRLGKPRVLIAAGPTHEPIDAVRFVGNRSSGRMGLALASAAVQRGWPTTLLMGPTALDLPENPQWRTIRFQSTADLQSLLNQLWPDHDLLLMAAAVADFTPVAPPSSGKLERNQGLTLELKSTPDLLVEIAKAT